MISSIKNHFYKSFLYLLFICLSVSTIAQNNENVPSVTGKVTDAATGKLLTNAEIKVPGYSSAITKDDGTFTINVPTLFATINVNAQGYNTKVIALCGRNAVSVSMVTELAETAFQSLLAPQGVRLNSNYSNALEQKDNFSFYTGSSLEELIQREFGSVKTTVRSGQPGIGANMFIRGYNSINGNSQPLIVVDGVVFDQSLNTNSVYSGFFTNPLTGIDTKDIERISVLKDGSSIYGMQGANGVILIETKRAKEATTKVSAYITGGVNQTPKNIPMMNGYDYRVYAVEQSVSGGLTGTLINALPFMNEDKNYAYYYKYHNNINWQDAIYNNSINKNAYLTVSGGDDIAKYALSVGFSNYAGIISNTDMTKLNTRFNADVAITSKLTFQTNVGFSSVGNNVRDDGMNDMTGVRYLALTKSPLLDFNQHAMYTGENSPVLEDVDFWGKTNPIELTQSRNAVGKADQYRMTFSGKFIYDITKTLKASTLVGVLFDNNREAYSMPNVGVADFILEKGIGYKKQQKQLDRMLQMYNDTRIEYNKTFANVHNINAIAGMRLQTSHRENDYLIGYGASSEDDSKTLMLNTLLFKDISGYNTNYKYLSWFGNVDYNFNSKYFLTLGLSADASSRFGKEAQGGVSLMGYPFAVLPTVSASWNVTNENFMKDLTAIDLLKVRVGYAVTANDVFADNLSTSYYTSNLYVYSASGLVLGGIANPKLKWETGRKINVGAELALFNEALILTGDYYTGKTEDLVVSKSSSFIGSLPYYINEGSLQNSGFEIGANLRLINNKNWLWNAGFSVAKYKNTVTGLSEDIKTNAFGGTVLTQNGLPLGVFYGYKTNGIYTTADAAQTGNLKTMLSNGTYLNFAAGDVRFVDMPDKNGVKDGIINEKDMQVIGDPTPNFTGTIHSNLKYKRFTLDLNFVYSVGSEVYNALRSNLESMSSYNNQSASTTDRWRVDGQITTMPRAVFGDPAGNARFSDRWIEDGSYLRLKTVALSYQLPVKLSFVQGIMAYATANNVLLFTHYLGSDPEVSASNSSLLQGIDAGLLPQFRTFSFGLKIDL